MLLDCFGSSKALIQGATPHTQTSAKKAAGIFQNYLYTMSKVTVKVGVCLRVCVWDEKAKVPLSNFHA